ncbi:MAG: tetratricopeptide repeat protein [Chloroflexota bacterium]
MATLRTLEPRLIRLRSVAILTVALAMIVAGTASSWNLPALGSTAVRPLASPAAAAAAGPVDATVTIPGAGVVLPAPGSVAQLDHNIAAWSRNLAANPQDFISATNLAILYHARARLTADLADHERALEATRVAIKIAPDQGAARALEAAILYSLHDFHGAFAAADALVSKDPTQFGALATRADASLELGNLDAARADLATLVAKAPNPAVDVRRARLAEVTGDLDGAVALATAARDAVAADGDDTGFYEYALAEYQRNAGLPAAAGTSYAAAVQLRASDLGALLGLARIQAFNGDLDGAIATLGSATAIAPTPEAEALLGDLLASRNGPGDAAAARAAFGTVRLTRTLSALAGSVYDRTLIRFELDHGGATAAIVDQARSALLDRTDFGAHDLLAWALYRTGASDEAWAEITAAMSSGAADARTLFHAGAIAAARGDASAASGWLQRAVDLGPALDPIERVEAMTILANLTSGGSSATR